MPFTVTPVDQVDIDFSSVELGDRLAITLNDDDWTRIILTAVKSPYVRQASDKPELALGLMPEHVPSEAYPVIHEVAAKILEVVPRNLEIWFQQLELAMDPYTELVSAILDDKPAVIQDVQIGKIPTVSFRAPFTLDYDTNQQLTWQPSTSIRNISPATEWDAALAAGRIRAERELHALRVR